MPEIQRYQPRRGSSGPRSWRRFVLPLILIIAVILIIKTVSGRDKKNTSKDDSNETGVTLVNDGANTNIQLNNAPLGNSNANSNANTNTAVTESTGTFSMTLCKDPISQYGAKKVVALTFDVAAANEAAQKLIDQLSKAKVPSSWFVSGSYASKNAEFIAKISQAGFGVYNRSFDNPKFSTLSAADISLQLSKADAAIVTATGKTTKPFFRPPYGDYSEEVVTAAQADGYCTILQTVDALDWQDGITQDQSKQRILAKLRPGAIIGLHAGYDLTPPLVADLITTLQAQGYSFVSLPALLGSS